MLLLEFVVLGAVAVLAIVAAASLDQWHLREQARVDEIRRRALAQRDPALSRDQYRRERAPQLASLQTRAAKGIDARRQTVLGHTAKKEAS